MEIKFDDGKCTINIKDWYEDVTFTSSDSTLLNLLSMLQKESIYINGIYGFSNGLCIAVCDTLTYDQILLIEQILGNINISIDRDIQCIPFLEIKVNCDYLEERFEHYKEYF